MQNVKEVGIIGQKYEDRNTGKVGILDSRDDKCKTLMMIDGEGKGFNVSYSSFKSRWRKCVEEEEVVKEENIVQQEEVQEVVKDVDVVSNKKYKILMSPDKTSCTIWCADDRAKHCIFILNVKEFYVTMPKSMLEIVNFSKFDFEVSFDDGFAVEYIFKADLLKDVYTEVINSIEMR